MKHDASEIGLRAVGIAQAFESGLRCSVSIVFRLLLGFLVGLPPTAIAVNGAVSYALTVLLEIPAGLFADRLGCWLSVRLGYIMQSVAAFALLGGLMAWPRWPLAMWCGVVLEGVLDAFGNALLSGAREVVFKDIVTAAVGGAGSGDQDKRRALEQDFLALSEAYGRAFVVLLPALYLGLTMLARSGAFPVAWVLAPIGIGWLALMALTARLVRRFPATRAATAPGRWRVILRQAYATIASFPHEARGAAASYVGFTFAFGVIHGYLILGLLREPRSWFADHLWWSIVVANFAFIAGRILRSFVMPAILRRVGPTRAARLGAVAAVALSLAFFGVYSFGHVALTAAALLIFAALFDNAIGLATRPALGLLLHAAPPAAAASVLSVLSQMATLLGAAYAGWLMVSGRGVPSVLIAVATVVVTALVVRAVSAVRARAAEARAA